MASEYFEINFSVWDYWTDEKDLFHAVIDIGGKLTFVERQLIRNEK